MDQILKNLGKAILEYDKVAAASCARKAVEEGIDPLEAMGVVTEATSRVCKDFTREKVWLPELVGAVVAAQAATPIIETEIRRRGRKRESLGCVVIGTVFGDVHGLGKDIVAAFLAANGFEVINLGENVPTKQFISAVREHNADILAMSALVTMAALAQTEVINALKKETLRDKLKIIVGGGAVTEEFAARIGADAYGASAMSAPDLFKRLIGKGGKQ